MLTGLAGTDYARLFSHLDIQSRASVIAAVSGGSDSTALLLLLNDYIARFAPRTRLVVATVDHALRPGSADEASEVAKLCSRLGISHVIQTWQGAKPTTGVAAAAREARHELLARAAIFWKTDLVFTGHTADDQAETVLMRQARDSGRGLAGIAPATLFDQRVWFVRPLLPMRRSDLRAFLRRNQATWIDDPSNDNAAFERPRVRRKLQDSGGEYTIEGALEIARQTGLQREAIGRAAAQFIQNHVTRPCAGLLRIDRQALAEAETELSTFVFRILLATAGGTPHLPDERRARALLQELAEPGPVRKVLSRTLVDGRRDALLLLRESRMLPAPTEYADGSVWDGRYRIVALPDASGCIEPAGPEAVRSIASSDQAIPDSLIRSASAREPAIRCAATGDRDSATHQTSATVSLVPVVAPWARFLPSFDMAPARAMAELLGADKLPNPPFREHIGCKA